MLTVRIARATLGIALIAVAGCSSPRVELTPPRDVVWTLEQRAGSVVGGPATVDRGEAEHSGEAPWRVEIVAFGLGIGGSDGELQPLAASTWLAISPRSSSPVLAVAGAGAGVLLARGAFARVEREHAELLEPVMSRVLAGGVAELAPGTFVELAAASPDPPAPLPPPAGGTRDRGSAPLPPPAPNPPRERVALLLGREDGELRVALRLPAPPRPLLPEVGAPGASGARESGDGERELIVLAPDVLAEGELFVRVQRPFPAESLPSIGIAVRRLHGEERASEGLTEWAAAASHGAGSREGYQTLALAYGAVHTRAALAYLAMEADAPALLSLMASAEPQELLELMHAMQALGTELEQAGVIAPFETGDVSALGWHFERVALRHLLARAGAGAGAGEEGAAPAARARLLARAGEAGAYPTSLADAVEASASIQQLDAWLLAENLAFLADRSPAARVRAFDWLAQRDAAPSGYDPLGPDAERRAALQRAQREREAAAAEGSE